MGEEINVLALVKDGHRYIFLYDESSHDELLQTLGRNAADPDLNFSWYDAAVMSQRVRALRRDKLKETTQQESFYRKSA
ncbi:hypothetical protein [Rubinisphaera sp.]|uniref:hypothetical protein n=1 Tax=Rubinisphaera sp. TaxID=2024857 RepID=UPI000C1123AD|nr:hypothetical protein [Rubinisphaera sp.]MBV08920.1 hypothetical protein [Rubinisphaera sp.]|tara:strand:- start:1148 stop:1384 length:237 start_codon:yes stop_codon:yes gene_type:complete